MQIEFATNRLAAAGLSYSEVTRLFGVPIGRKYVQTLAVLRAAEVFTELYAHRAHRLHPMKGDRAGGYAITLTGNHRLIIEQVREDAIRILGVEDYHGD